MSRSHYESNLAALARANAERSLFAPETERLKFLARVSALNAAAHLPENQLTLLLWLAERHSTNPFWERFCSGVGCTRNRPSVAQSRADGLSQ